MASKAAELLIRILGDASDAVGALNQTDKAVGNTVAGSVKGGAKMAGIWASVGAAMTACARSAAQLEQATFAVTTVFGDQADEMSDWADGMAQYGLSTAQASAAAAVLGAQLKNTGASAEQMAQITQGLVETSVALANVMGGTAVEAVGAMGAALRGEFDTLERYGISLTADAVATEVARLAAEGYTFASEQQAKTVATLSLIQQQAAVILGESTEQTMTATTATDHLKASIANLAAAIGGPLIGVLTPLIELLADTIDKVVTFWNESEVLQAILETLASVLQTIADILNATLIPVLQRAVDVLESLGDLVERFVTPVMEALAAALDTVAQALSTVIGWVQEAIGWFESLIDTVHEAIDSLTFWNDTYAESTAPLALTAGAGPTIRTTAAAGPPAVGSRSTVNIYMGVVTDPHGTARTIRNLLAAQNVEQGRAADEMLPRRSWG